MSGFGDAREILRARAVQLARPLESAVASRTDLELVVFSVGTERYAIDTALVREVLPLPDVTPLPGVARVFVGITSLRGEIVPVAAIERLFGGVGAAPVTANYVVVLGEARAECALLATAVHEILALDSASLSGAARESSLTRGVTRDGMVVLDASAVLDDPRLAIADDSSEG